jgi:N-methylhydantoinase B
VRTIPVEATEAVASVIFRRREFREGSGGVGRYRGGLGQIIELGGADGTPIAMLCNFERVGYPAPGRDGGGAGAPGRVTLISGRPIGPRAGRACPAAISFGSNYRGAAVLAIWPSATPSRWRSMSPTG